ncbi:hypothetical protein LHP98_12190 [Rhodobacter sp. Har01]|uniref:hypothetical protein n=1 Tax=Rhodobacter sp. Har01 TaxID=2883999 RepID=UPI001D08F803|nr:hypothetical protein [Rhodobacter sp. Har01]MCB6178886.1 hypothetical protein [Rhodobacter sp. Har01]
MRAALMSLALLAPSAALADCPGEVVFSCPIKGKVLEVCHDGSAAQYVFGRPGTPDLTIRESLATLAFQPWPGIGRTIWQSVRFQNDDVVYEVWSSVDKPMEENAPDPDWAGGVIVTRADETLAELACSDPPDPPFLDALYDAKVAVGQCWNFDSQAWQAAPCP